MAAGVRLSIQMDGKDVTRLKAALSLLGEQDAPHLREALEVAARKFRDEIASRAPGRMGGAAKFLKVAGTGAGLRGTGTVGHPGSRSMEFGRVWYWRGFSGNNRPGSPRTRGSMRRGVKWRVSGGQAARPYMGIKAGDMAVAAVQPFARRVISEAIAKEWERIGGGAT